MPPQYYTVIGHEYLGPAVLRSELSPHFDDKSVIRTARVEIEHVWSGIRRVVGECEIKRWRGTTDEAFGGLSIWVKNRSSRNDHA